MSLWQDLVDPGRSARNQLENTYNTLRQQGASERNSRIGQANYNRYTNSQNLTNYLNSLANANQINYNQGVSSAQRQAANNANTIRQTMANRGVTSGVDIKNMANSQGNLARAISSLQAQRNSADADYAKQKYNLTAQNNSNAFNEAQNAYNYTMPIDSATQGQLSYLNEQANQQSPLLSLISTGVNAAMGNWGGALGSMLGSNMFGSSSSSGNSGNLVSGLANYAQKQASNTYNNYTGGNSNALLNSLGVNNLLSMFLGGK